MSKIKKIIQSYIQTVQKVLIPVLLTVVYILGIGASTIFLFVCGRRFLRKKHKKNNTSWVKAKGYGVDTINSLRQS